MANRRVLQKLFWRGFRWEAGGWRIIIIFKNIPISTPISNFNDKAQAQAKCRLLPSKYKKNPN
jgi:hypothetical protein